MKQWPLPAEWRPSLSISRCGLLVSLLLVGVCSHAAPKPADKPEALVTNGVQAVDAGNYAAAVDLLQQAVTIRPQWATPHRHLAMAYQYLGDEQRACQEYKWLSLNSMGYDPTDSENIPETVMLMAECEVRGIWLTNESRRQRNVCVLLVEPDMNTVARGHCEEMRDRSFWSHYSPTPGRRNVVERFGQVYPFRPRLLAENLARRWGTRYSLTVHNIERTHADLLASPHHSQNILRPDLRRIGVGIAVNDNGDYWLGQVMANFGPTHGDN